jgi:hypothetical protein
MAELRSAPAHTVRHLLFYAVTPEAEPRGVQPVLIDTSAPEIIEAWRSAMESHASQSAARPYVELQLTRARLLGLRAGVGYAMALYPNDPVLLNSLGQLGSSARRF